MNMNEFSRYLDSLPTGLDESGAKKVIKLQEIVKINLYPGKMGVDKEGNPLNESQYDDTSKFSLVKQNPFDIKKLVDKGVIFITKPGNGKGGVEEPNWEGDASILSLYNIANAEPWMKKAVKSLMPQAIPHIQKDQDKLLYNGKYNQILWSISKKGFKPEDFYLTISENDNLDLSVLKGMAGDIEDELEKIPTSEIVGLATTALVLGLPSILNVVAKAAKTLLHKSGINLSKKESVLDYIIRVSGEIDGYLDGPFRTILKPFVQNEAKRKKIAGVLKSITLIMLGTVGGVDISKVDKVVETIKGLAPDIGQELLQTKLPNIVGVLKDYFKTL